jgi:peroxiredoxin
MRSEQGLRATLVAAVAAIAAGAGPPPLELADLDGARVKLARSEGERALIVHFWATWCPSCVVELPVLEQSLDACTGSGVRLVAVSVGEKAEPVRRFLDEQRVALPVLLDPGGDAWRRAGLRELPASLIWDDSGVRIERGARSAQEWREQLGALGCAAR